MDGSDREGMGYKENKEFTWHGGGPTVIARAANQVALCFHLPIVHSDRTKVADVGRQAGLDGWRDGHPPCHEAEGNAKSFNTK